MPSRTSNHVLMALSSKDRAILEPDLEPVDMPLRRPLATRNRPIEHVYFMDSGIASVVTNGSLQPIEVGIIGREGISSLGAIMGQQRSDHDIYMQMPGTARRIKTSIICEADESNITLHRVLMRYVYSFIMQISNTALANGRNKTEQRLARWLLLAQDRAGDELTFTQDFLGLMLGTARPGVSLAVQALVGEELISTKRGRITVVDREGLIVRCNGAYSPPE